MLLLSILSSICTLDLLRIGSSTQIAKPLSIRAFILQSYYQNSREDDASEVEGRRNKLMLPPHHILRDTTSTIHLITYLPSHKSGDGPRSKDISCIHSIPPTVLLRKHAKHPCHSYSTLLTILTRTPSPNNIPPRKRDEYSVKQLVGRVLSIPSTDQHTLTPYFHTRLSTLYIGQSWRLDPRGCIRLCWCRNGFWLGYDGQT